MSIDISKLSPAPWRLEHISSNEKVGIQSPRACLFDMHQATFTDAEFVALARNAFEVMMRWGIFPVQVQEGWSVWCTTPQGWPAALFGVALTDKRLKPSLWPGPWPDPFTALVEAEKWYVENIEQGKP